MSEQAVSHSNEECRLCGGGTEQKFKKTILGKYTTNYFECRECHSLQTETPHWLSEAYGCNLSNLDTGAAQRNIQNLVAVYTIAKTLKLGNILDAGGGDGLLCRLLRDHELNCFVIDKYAKPTYAQGYSEPPFSSPDLLIAFEVLEHYPHPKEDLAQLFAFNPRALVATTVFYQEQGNDWWYLAPESGQHVFFYNRKAIELTAVRYGYELIFSGGFIIFLKEGQFSAFRKRLLHRCLGKSSQRLIRILLLDQPTPGVWKDHLEQLQTVRNAGNGGQEQNNNHG